MSLKTKKRVIFDVKMFYVQPVKNDGSPPRKGGLPMEGPKPKFAIGIERKVEFKNFRIQLLPIETKLFYNCLLSFA
jgi:hypothetical protein